MMMRFSYYTPEDNLTLTTGYGNAGFKVVTSLQALGHEVKFNDPAQEIGLAFCSPNQYKFHDGQYRIGYTPWESTKLPDGWVKNMNNCDEVWATSPWCANVYDFAGVKSDKIHVYEHGVDPIWRPVDRKPSGKVRFLHVGEPAIRKGGQWTLDAFREAFGDSEDVHLTFKTYDRHRLVAWTENGLRLPDVAYNNVSVVSRTVTESELFDLYASHDVMVYPSFGEGFGLMPLQALATGMPTICTAAWAPYKEWLGPLALDSSLGMSVWPLHPGQVYYPDFWQLVKLMRHSVRRIHTLQSLYHAQAEQVIKEYDWLTNTERITQHLVERFTGN